MNASNMNDTIPFRDRMLTAEEAANWLGIPVCTLMEKHRAGVVPGLRVGQRTIRFLPRAIEAALAHRSRMSKEVVKLLATGDDYRIMIDTVRLIDNPEGR
jgi:hypothetical protein